MFNLLTAVAIVSSENREDAFSNFKTAFVFILKNFSSILNVFSAEDWAYLGSQRHLDFKLYLMIRKHNWIFNFQKWFQIMETEYLSSREQKFLDFKDSHTKH